jgi:hypothetical protein
MIPRVTALAVYSDGSGAPAVVHARGFTYACDFLGSVRVTCIATPSGRLAHGLAASAAREAREEYCERLFRETDQAWLDANRAMYATE